MKRVVAAVTGAVLLVTATSTVRRASAATADVKVVATAVNVRGATGYGYSDDTTTAILDAMFEAPARATYNLSRLGSGLARQRILDSTLAATPKPGTERFAIAGSPFSADDEAALKAAGKGLVRVPVHPVGMGMILSGPAEPLGPGWYTNRIVPNPFEDPADPFDDFTSEAGPVENLDGPHPEASAFLMKLPWKNLAGMMLQLGASRLNSWFEPGLMATWGFTLDPVQGLYKRDGSDYYILHPSGPTVPQVSTRFEPSATNLYLQEAIVLAAHDVWVARLPNDPPAAEQWQARVSLLSRGLEGTVTLLGQPELDVSKSGSPPMGTMGPMPVWGIEQVRANFPGKNLKFWVAELLNNAGDWVAPTSASISAAVAAGGDEPLYALTHKVPGGYPLTWTESMYAPATGLSIAETNAVSALGRFIVTDGQDIARAKGDGVLSPALVKNALDALNAIVTTNCTAAGGVPFASATSPYYPPAANAPKLALLAPQTVCGTEVAPAPTTTTTAAPTTTTVAVTTTAAATTTTSGVATTQATTATTSGVLGGSTQRTNAPSGTRATTATTPATTAPVAATTTVAAASATTTTTSTVVATPTTTIPALADDQQVGAPLDAVLSSLPMGLPSDGRGYDRVTTMLLGAAVVLYGRRRWLRRMRIA